TLPSGTTGAPAARRSRSIIVAICSVLPAPPPLGEEEVPVHPRDRGDSADDHQPLRRAHGALPTSTTSYPSSRTAAAITSGGVRSLPPALPPAPRTTPRPGRRGSSSPACGLADLPTLRHRPPPPPPPPPPRGALRSSGPRPSGCTMMVTHKQSVTSGCLSPLA